MIPRLFTPLDLACGTTLQLDPAVAHHALRVLRLVAGEPVELFDGQGNAARATILSSAAGTVRVEHLLPPAPPPALSLTLAQCISAAEKMDWTIEKAVELGVSAIVPLQSRKATVRLTAERSLRRREHWQRLILAASAQCGQYRLPRLDDVARLEDWLKRPDPGDRILRVILDPRAPQPLGALLAAHEAALPVRGGGAEGGDCIWLLCGPESGFSDEEYQQAREAGWLPAGLGPRVLRTETAGLVALSIIQARWGDLR